MQKIIILAIKFRLFFVTRQLNRSEKIFNDYVIKYESTDDSNLMGLYHESLIEENNHYKKLSEIAIKLNIKLTKIYNKQIAKFKSQNKRSQTQILIGDLYLNGVIERV